ncbi:MAG: LytR family transcriptional regulator [Armatimonadetes bacterium]|nr:MAG: LytR family transcriptional regulator [Armatimonadota bacterium]
MKNSHTTVIRRTPPRSRRWLSALSWFAYAIVCAVALVGGTAAGWLKSSPVLSAMSAQFLTNKNASDVFDDDALTVLVLGCDEDRSRGGAKVVRENARSDMMLVTKIDFANKRVGGISIPRDLEVGLPGYRAQKINAYHSIGGKDLAKRAAESVLGVPIDRVIVLNYKAFQELVDVVGGVEVYVPKNMKYTDRPGDLYIDLKKGRQWLDGYQAMGFVRFRHSDSDFKRMERQRDFLFALKDRVMKNSSLLPTIVNKGSKVIGDEFSPDELASLALFLRGVSNDNIRMSSLPVVEGRGTNLNLDAGKLSEVLLENFLSGYAVEGRVSQR